MPHAADVAKEIDKEIDRKMSEARKDFDWGKQESIAIEPEKATILRSERPAEIVPETCSMCSEFCALKMVREYLEEK